MEFNILEEKENQLLGRKELRLELKHPTAATPAKQELVKELATKYSVPEEHVVIDFIFTKKGLQESVAKVKIYKERPKVKQRAIREKKDEKSEAQAGEAK
jgi:ribosomal protein S24E